MTDGWRIDPAAARGAIDAAAAEADGWSGLEVDLTAALSGVMQALGGHAPATAAKIGTIQTDPFEIDLLAARQHVTAAVTATRNAISAYEHGDEHMAAQYENGIER